MYFWWGGSISDAPTLTIALIVLEQGPVILTLHSALIRYLLLFIR